MRIKDPKSSTLVWVEECFGLGGGRGTWGLIVEETKVCKNKITKPKKFPKIFGKIIGKTCILHENDSVLDHENEEYVLVARLPSGLGLLL